VVEGSFFNFSKNSKRGQELHYWLLSVHRYATLHLERLTLLHEVSHAIRRLSCSPLLL